MFGKKHAAESGKKKYLYMFEEGNKDMRELLGGKGANLAEMTNIGLPVPQGFTITTEACTQYYEDGRQINDAIMAEIMEYIEKMEQITGKKFGDHENPLLVSVRSGARASMPGMMDTILNLGLNEDVVDVIAKKSNNPRWAWDCYRRFIQMYSDVVMEVGKKYFEQLIDEMKARKGVTQDVELTAEDLKELAGQFKAEYKAKIGQDFPSDPKEQLLGAIKAVFRSWDNPRANVYRRMNEIPYDWGTAVNVQSMAFGNSGNTSGTGVAFTRNPATGEKALFGEYLINAQGEDVVAGIRTPSPISKLAEEMPEVYKQFVDIASRLEKHYRDMQDMEFTVEHGKLYMLQTRNGKRTPAAALKIACDLVDEGMIDEKQAVAMIEPRSLDTLLHPQFDAEALKKAAIIGGGPTGIAAAYFLGRAGIPVTVFEQSHKLGGVPRLVIPGFRISEEAIEKDIALMTFYGAEVKLNTPAPSVSELKAMGYTHIFFAVGAGKAGQLDIPGNVVPVIQWLRDLKAGKDVSLGHVAVVGGGNTAMDAARAALRAGAKTSTLVYRRTKKYMPADAEELELAVEDGVRFLELVAPVEQANGKLKCEVMKLGDPDEKGRRSPVPTGEFTEIDCDTVIAAVGERVDSDLFTANGIEVNTKGIPEFRTNLENVFVGGDAMRGPATVVEGIADAQYFANAVIGSVHSVAIPDDAHATRDEAIARKGVLCPPKAGCEGERCLHCNTVCQVCADVCPNRANVVITLPDSRHEILHVDRMCNECGNCAVFCPYDSAPYRNKFTLFLTRDGFDESTENQGFLPLEGRKVLVRLDGKVFEADLDGQNQLPADVETFILTVLKDYAYLL